MGYSSSNRNIGPNSELLANLKPLVSRTKSVGTSSPTKKQEQAAAFVNRLKKDKQEREMQQKAITDAKDQAFLSKLQETMNNRKRKEEMERKDRAMRQQMMMRKLDQKNNQKLQKIENTRRLLDQNQYKPPLAPLPVPPA